MEIDIYQTVEESDGTISAYVHFIDDAGKIIQNACFQGKTQADFETAIEKKQKQIESNELKKTTRQAMVSAAITKIKEAN